MTEDGRSTSTLRGQGTDSHLRLALVGCGSFGMYLAEFVGSTLTDAEIVAVVEPDEARLVAAAEALGVASFESVESLVDQADTFEAAIIASPNHLHREHVIALASAGKYVFCEKPMAVLDSDCAAMVAASTANNTKLMVGHKRRLRPAWHRLIELAHGGAIGELAAVNVNGWHHHPDIPSWWLKLDEGGGLLHRAGVHDVDVCNALLGEPMWVHATRAGDVRPGAEFAETLWATVGYESGAVAGIQVCLWFEPIHFRDSFSVQVIGTRGSALLTNTADDGQSLTWGERDGQLVVERFDDGYDVAYAAELESFVKWVRDDLPPILSWREGWQAVRVMQGVYQSLADDARVQLEPVPSYKLVVWRA